MAMKVLIMMLVLVKCSVLARPQNILPDDWNEIVMSRQTFNDQGRPIGDAEMQVFVNPLKCNFALGKFIKLPCIKPKQMAFTYPKFQPEGQNYKNVQSQNQSDIGDNSAQEPGDSPEGTYEIPVKNLDVGNKGMLVTENRLLNPPQIPCPDGYRLDMFEKCRLAEYW